jgi:hypothetical protein
MRNGRRVSESFAESRRRLPWSSPDRTAAMNEALLSGAIKPETGHWLSPVSPVRSPQR